MHRTEVCAFDVRPLQVGLEKDRPPELRLAEISSLKLCAVEVRVPEVGFSEERSFKVGPLEVGLLKIGAEKIRLLELGLVEVYILKVCIFIDAWNERCQPFQWTKTPEQVLAKAMR